MFMDKPYILMAQTLTDSLLLHVSKEVVFEGIERDPLCAKRMLAGLSRRVPRADHRRRELFDAIRHAARDRLPAAAGCRAPGPGQHRIR